ncbi:methyltransferase domain-containing protein [Streptomyces sp. MS06]|uniref:methyltransferase domain-containing protein n=1 Tax=Streptomyces sp. MS06 TaxID=3385974 RepID=UPI0039A06838
MSHIRSHVKSLERSNHSLTRPDRPREFRLLDRDWDLLDEVFAPLYSPSTRIGAEFLGLTGTGSAAPAPSLLEVGCGTGLIAVQAALRGCASVVAADINEHAVENTRMNARRHRVDDRVTALRSDLFAALAPDARFDQVFWSSNYVLAPADYAYRSIHERAYVDAGYRTHRRYLSEVVHHLTDDGTALLHFSDRGNLHALREIAGECDRELHTLDRRTVEEGPDRVEHLLLEICPARARRRPAGTRRDLVRA